MIEHRISRAFCLCTIAAGLANAEPPAMDPLPIRILPLGDSITEGCCSDQPSGSYRMHLYTMLKQSGYNIDFVGTLNDKIPSALSDTDHQGAAGFTVGHIARNIDVWLKQIDDPDVILIHAGTNDFWVGASIETVTARLEGLLERITASRPHARIIVASLIIRGDQYEAIQSEFAALLPGLVARQASMGRNVSFADLHQALDTDDLMSHDSVHPATSGFIKMAGLWLPAVADVINPEGTDDAPAVVSAVACENTASVIVNFSKPVADSAAQTSNYYINGNLTVSHAALDEATKRFVVLTTGPQQAGELYTLTVNNIRDRTPEGKSIAPDTVAHFTTVLVANGSFESDGQQWQATGGAQACIDWPDATHGNKVAAFHGTSVSRGGALTQTIPTVPGRRYRIDFDCGTDRGDTTPRKLDLTIAGSKPLIRHTESFGARRFGDPAWALRSAEFIPDSAFTTISFEEASGAAASNLMLLDDVRVVLDVSENILLNGGFETGEYLSPERYHLANWTSSGNVVGLASDGPYASSDGARHAFFNEGSNQFNGLISQDFETEPGQSYTVSYDVGIIGPRIGTRQRLTCTVDDESGEAIAAWQDDLEVVSPVLEARYVRKFRRFTAAGHRTVLTFRDQVPDGPSDNSDLLLDDVRVMISQDRGLTVSAEQTGGITIDGLDISVSPPDFIGLAGGSTPFVREFEDAEEVRLIAPITHENLVFKQWQLNGIAHGNNPDLIVTLGSDLSVVAVYAPHTPALASNDIYLAEENATRIVGISSGVLSNDEPSSAALPIWAIMVPDSGPYNGQVTFNSDGSFVYVPNDGFIGNDGFRYRVSDGIMESIDAEVIIQVSPRTGGLLVNGGFEMGDLLNPADGFRTVLDGWSVEGNVTGLISVDQYTANQGSRMAFFNERSNRFSGVISQQFDTVPGESYIVSYDAGIIGPVIGSRQRLECILSCESNGDLAVWQDDLEVVTPGLQTSFSRKYRSFTADSHRTTITFRDVAPDGVADNSDLMVDDVKVTRAQDRLLSVTCEDTSGELLTDILISMSKEDLEGLGDGTGRFDRIYRDIEELQLVAPLTQNGLVFLSWRSEGVELATNTAITVNMTSDRSVTAVYGPHTPVVAMDDSYVTHQGTPRFIRAAHGVLANDTYASKAAPPSAALVDGSGPSHGELTLMSDGSFVYVPEKGFLGHDSFRYRANDGILDSIEAVVNIEVMPGTGGMLVNGGFEVGDMLEPADPFRTALDGWHASGNVSGLVSVDQYAANQGRRMAFFNERSNEFNGILSQEFDTEPGQAYTISYDVGIIGPTPGTRQRLVGRIEGDSTDPLASWQDDLEVQTPELQASFIRRFHSFVADGTRTTVTFKDQAPDGSAANSDLMLDNVWVTPGMHQNNPPLFLSSPLSAATGTAGVAYTGTIAGSAIDPDQDPISYIKLDGPDWLTVAADGTLTGSPASQHTGISHFTIAVSDGSNTVEATLNIVISAAEHEDDMLSWMAEHGLDGLPADDSDGDGLSNLLEYALGGDPKGSLDSGLLPVLAKVEADPAGTGEMADFLRFSFRRSHRSAANQSLAISIEYSRDLQSDWQELAGFTSEDKTTKQGVIIIQEPDDDDSVAMIHTYVPMQYWQGGRLFVRLACTLSDAQ